MENRVFLERYRLSLGRNGLPVELHRSATARTFRAHEIESGREVALTLAPAPAPNDVTLLERLESEAAAAKSINQINIPRLCDFGRENGELIYVSEYCEGHTAAAWSAARGPLPIDAVLRVALQASDAMNAAAFQRLHHPVLNPDNILFVGGQTTEGDWPAIKILHWFAPAPDFSRMDDERIDNAARFAAPEQLSEGRIDVRSEIYSLGATVWFLLTGAPPASAAAGWMPDPGAGSNLRGAPKIVRHLLDRMLCVNPDERPQDPVALGSYLQTCLSRVDRQGKIKRRLGVPLFLRSRPVETAARPPVPIKALAWAAGCLALVAFGLVFLPWPVAHSDSTAARQQSILVPHRSPNELATLVRTEPKVETKPAGTLASVAANRPPVTAETPPARFAAADQSSSPTFEPPVPAEGPAETAAPTPPPVDGASAPEETSSSPRVAETNEPEPAPTPEAAPPTPAAPVADEDRPALASSPPANPRSSALTNGVAAHRSTKSKSATAHKNRRVAHHVKRAIPLPKLRVGSSPAELVGTTADGRWILSVSDSGRRIIVPPPPGFGR